MKTAIIGLGIIGKIHIHILQEQGYDIIAVCDNDLKKLKEFDCYKGYIDYNEMLDKERPDVVHICTPHFLHTQMILAVLKRNINCLCEKPLCMLKEDIAVILKAEMSSTGLLGVCHQNRFNDASLAAKRMLDGKEILSGYGSVVWHRDKAYYDSADWRGKWKTAGGGVLINQALHTLDLLIWLGGYPQGVTATTSNLVLKDFIEVEDTATAVMDSGDCALNFFATNTSMDNFPIEINLSIKGSLVTIKQNSLFENDKLIELGKQNQFYGKPYYGFGHERLFAEFYSCISESRPFSINGIEAAKVVTLILSIYESKGERIKL